MATITFSYSPDHNENDIFDDASMLLPSVEYSINIPANVELTTQDIKVHFDRWLKGLGY